MQKLGSQFESARDLDAFLHETRIRLERSTMATFPVRWGNMAALYAATRKNAHLPFLWLERRPCLSAV